MSKRKSLNWEEICKEYEVSDEPAVQGQLPNYREEKSKFKQLAKPLNNLSAEEQKWFIAALENPRKKWFVVTLFEYIQTLPATYFTALVKAAVYEKNPSSNQYFIRPALRSYGHRAVFEELLKYLEEGSNFEKAGALKAFYVFQKGFYFWESLLVFHNITFPYLDTPAISASEHFSDRKQH